MTTPPTNLFTTISSSLKSITADLAQDEHNNRIQRESLIGTKMVNDFQTAMSQELLDQSVNYDGTYDAHAVNTEKFNTRYNQMLGGIKNDRIRNIVDQQISNYKPTYETASKVQSLKLEGELQTNLDEDNLSYNQAIISSDPSQYDQVKAKYDQEVSTYRPDIKEKLYRNGISRLNSTYIDSQYEAYRKDYLTPGGEIKTTQDLLAKVEALKARVNSQDFYLTPEKRDAANAFLDNRINTQMEALQKTRDSMTQANLEASLATFSKTGQVPAAPGLSSEQTILNQIADAYPNDPTKQNETQIKFEVAALEAQTRQAIAKSGFDQAEDVYHQMISLKQSAITKGDYQRAVAYESGVESIRKIIDDTRKSINDNSADYWLNEAKDLNIDMTYGIPESRANEGQRDYSQYANLIYEKTYTIQQDAANIKFLPTQKVNYYKDKLNAIERSGNFDEFVLFANNLRHDWGTIPPGMVGGIDVYESVLKQLNSKDDKSGKTAPNLGFALKAALKDPANAEDIFILLTAKNAAGDGPRGLIHPDKIKESDITKAIESEYKELQKAYSNYPNFLPGQDPIENDKQLVKLMAMNSAALSSKFNDVKNAKDLVKKVKAMTIDKEIKVVQSSAARGPVAIPVNQYSEAVGSFVQSRNMFQLFMGDLKANNTPTPITEIMGAKGLKPPGEEIDTFNPQKAEGLLTPGTFDIGTQDLKPLVAKLSGSNNWALVATVIDGKEVSAKEAIDYAKSSGRNLGLFSNVDAANKFKDKLDKHLVSAATNPLNATFTSPVAKSQNLFEVDKNGFLKNVKYNEAGQMQQLKYQQLLTNGLFLPVNDGSKYRLYAYFTGDNTKKPLITGQDQDGKPVYFDIEKKYIEDTLYPKYRSGQVTVYQ